MATVLTPAEIKQKITDWITTNGQGDITGAHLNTILAAIMDYVGVGYAFMGEAPASAPSPDVPSAYLAAPGTYTNYESGDTVIPEGSIAVLKFDGSAWSKSVIKVCDPVSVSQNTSTGGTELIIGNTKVASLDDVFNINVYFDRASYYNSMDSAVAAIPLSKRKIGLVITYLLEDGWKIAQYIGNSLTDDDFGNRDNWTVFDCDEIVSVPFWMQVTLDKTGKIIQGINREGKKVFIPLIIQGTTFETKKDALGRAEIIVDKSGRIVSYRDKNGVLNECVGIKSNGISLTDKGMTQFQKDLRDSGFNSGTGDWSNYVSDDGDNPLCIPVPQCAMLNIISDFDLTQLSKASRGGTAGVDYDIPTRIQFYDMQGNYFEKMSAMSGQGDSTMMFKKKNIALDLFDSEVGGDAFAVQFGGWVPQDSFHLKAYTNDAFHCVGLAAYKIHHKILSTRNINDRFPYNVFADKWGNIDWEGDYSNMIDGHKKISDNYDFSAKCSPDGFPVIVYQNGNFFGIYCWQIKKNRKNYHLNKNTATNVHLDGILSAATIWAANGDNSKIGWENGGTGFEIRNPKDSNLILMDGTQYDADFNPGELIDETSPYYNADNPKHVISKNTKACIVNLSKYMTELKALEAVYINASGAAKETALTALKSGIEERFNVSFMIDYLITVNVLQDDDSVAKNWQWVTWNGIQWCPCLYDCDLSFGNSVGGNVLFPANNIYVGANAGNVIYDDRPTYWIYEYYREELEARYKELRDNNILSADSIVNELEKLVRAIGENNYERENSKWVDSPCNRDSGLNSDYWELISNWAQGPVTYDDSHSYSIGDECVYGEDGSAYWTYRFRCKQACQGEKPCITYNNVIAYLGRYDSLYRVYAWEKQKIDLLDSMFNYN